MPVLILDRSTQFADRLSDLVAVVKQEIAIYKAASDKTAGKNKTGCRFIGGRFLREQYYSDIKKNKTKK